jgi:hypothetical protein
VAKLRDIFKRKVRNIGPSSRKNIESCTSTTRAPILVVKFGRRVKGVEVSILQQ